MKYLGFVGESFIKPFQNSINQGIVIVIREKYKKKSQLRLKSLGKIVAIGKTKIEVNKLEYKSNLSNHGKCKYQDKIKNTTIKM